MGQALWLAERGLGRTTPNPAVGALVIAAGGVVVTSGSTDWAHGLAGRDPQVEQITRNVLDLAQPSG